MTKRRGIRVVVLALALAAPAASQPEDAVAAQDRRDYESLKVRREQLLDELRRAWRDLDGAPEGEGSSATRLSNISSIEGRAELMEAELVVLMHRGRDLRREIREARLRGGSGDEGVLSGDWRLTFGGATGSMEMVQVGAFVSGSWTLSGSGGGTFIGHGGRGRALVMLIDDRGDLFATLRGTAGEATMDGTYLRTDLSSGEPAQGEWSAARTGSRR